MEVKKIGAIPVKNAKGEAIQWIKCDKDSIRKLMQQSNRLATERIFVDLGDDHRARGLGCSICKGPLDRPGIYIQSIKANGTAIRSGLQLGDQILRCNSMSFEGSGLQFSSAVAQLRGHRCLDLIVRRGAGLDLIGADEVHLAMSSTTSNPSSSAGSSVSEKLMEEGKKLLQSQVQIERRKLEQEQERLKRESERIENEKQKLEHEKQKLEHEKLRKTASEESTTSSTSITDNSSMGSSSSGGLVGAIQSELKRRAEASKGIGGQQQPIKSIIKSAPNKSGAGVKNMKKPVTMIQNDKHDQLMAEFRRVHKKMFASSSTEDEDVGNLEEVVTDEAEAEIEDCKVPDHDYSSGTDHQEDLVGNLSVDETLARPVKAAPPPPQRTSSISPPSLMTSSPAPPLSTFKPLSGSGSGSPGIPTPDYDTNSGSSPEPVVIIETTRSKGVKPIPIPIVTSISSPIIKKSNPRTKTFSKRHPPHTEVGSLDSFSVDDDHERSKKATRPPPPYYYDPPKSIGMPYMEDKKESKQLFNFLPQPSSHVKNVRFDVGEEAAIAAHDYRIAHATRKAIKYSSELHKTFAVRSGVKANSLHSSSSGLSSSSRNLTSSSEEDELIALAEMSRNRAPRARSPKKYPAPPPPPPPPAPPTPSSTLEHNTKGLSHIHVTPKNITKGI
jgi:hypothetical protein